MVTPELADAARRLLVPESAAATSNEVAKRAAHACEQLQRHLARLLGETGVGTLFNRSVHLSSASFPWLASASAKATDGPVAALRARLESQSPEAAVEAFVLVLSTYVGLLGRLIGEGLLTRVLHEVWPTVFPDREKEST